MRNFVANLKWELHKEPNKNNAGYIGEKLVEKLKFGKSNLADVEQELRDCHTNIYLLALPLEAFGNAMLDTFYPGKQGYYPYALWICVNGKAEAEREMLKHNLTPIDNLVKLHSCGFLTLKK
jgi:hypothetical protein